MESHKNKELFELFKHRKISAIQAAKNGGYEHYSLFLLDYSANGYARPKLSPEEEKRYMENFDKIANLSEIKSTNK